MQLEREKRKLCIFLYEQRRRKLTLFEIFMRANRKGANTQPTVDGNDSSKCIMRTACFGADQIFMV